MFPLEIHQITMGMTRWLWYEWNMRPCRKPVHKSIKSFKIWYSSDTHSILSAEMSSASILIRQPSQIKQAATALTVTCSVWIDKNVAFKIYVSSNQYIHKALWYVTCSEGTGSFDKWNPISIISTVRQYNGRAPPIECLSIDHLWSLSDKQQLPSSLLSIFHANTRVRLLTLLKENCMSNLAY